MDSQTNSTSIITTTFDDHVITFGFDDYQHPASIAVVINNVERWFLTIFVSTMTLFTFVINGCTIGVIRTQSRFRKPYYTVMLCFAVVNIGILLPFTFVQLIPRLFMNDFHDYPLALCRLFSDISITFIFMSLSSTAILCMARYLYFCRPIIYMTYVSRRVVYAAFACAFLLSASYTVATELAVGRVPVIHSLSCQLPNSIVNILLQNVLFILIPLVIIIVCARAIYGKIVRKRNDSPGHQLETLPNLANAVEQARANHPQQNSFSLKHAWKAIKLVAILSGTFLVMQLIPFIARLIMALLGVEFSSGLNGDFPLSTFVLRWVDMIYGVFYPSLNPLILWRLDKQYRWFRRFMTCRRNQVAFQPQQSTQEPS